MIMTAVERVEMVLKEVDDFVKLPSMERKLHKIDLLIQDSIENHQQDWQQRNLNPVLTINSSNLMVPLDAQLFAKALTMIFKEIFASVPPGSVVKIDVDDSGSDVQIAFGEVNELESVCELFDPRLRGKPWSLGLSLNIAQKIIKDHGGRLLLNPQSSSAFPLIARVPNCRPLTLDDCRSSLPNEKSNFCAKGVVRIQQMETISFNAPAGRGQHGCLSRTGSGAAASRRDLR